jgi:transposase InsO family protein
LASLSIRSDNTPAFLAEIVQVLDKILKIKWKLHTVYRPQSSGKAEHMNRILKLPWLNSAKEHNLPG